MRISDWSSDVCSSDLTEHQRHGGEHRRERRHQDRPEAQQRGLMDCGAWRQAFVTLRIEREVDHHDRVLLDDADQQNDADDRSEEHTSELQSLMSIPYAVFCLKKKKKPQQDQMNKKQIKQNNTV